MRRIFKDYVTGDQGKAFLKRKGILAFCLRKESLADIGANHYFDRESYVNLKKTMDVDNNYRKASRVSFDKKNVNKFQEIIENINNTIIDETDNTKVRVTRENGKTKIMLKYESIQPSKIDLLDYTQKELEITLNEGETKCSLDYNIESPADGRKVQQLLDYVNKDEKKPLTFEMLSLEKLKATGKIELFDNLFQHIPKPWSLEEIRKLKVKRNSKEEKLKNDQLEGINSAALDGKNLIENPFVKGTIKQGFYFSMVCMRLEHEENSSFIDLTVEFKTKPESTEIKIESSGYYKQEGNEIQEIKKVLSYTEQDSIIFEFGNILQDLFDKILEKKDENSVNLEVLTQTATTVSDE